MIRVWLFFKDNHNHAVKSHFPDTHPEQQGIITKKKLIRIRTTGEIPVMQNSFLACAQSNHILLSNSELFILVERCHANKLLCSSNLLFLPSNDAWILHAIFYSCTWTGSSRIRLFSGQKAVAVIEHLWQNSIQFYGKFLMCEIEAVIAVWPQNQGEVS